MDEEQAPLLDIFHGERAVGTDGTLQLSTPPGKPVGICAQWAPSAAWPAQTACESLWFGPAPAGASRIVALRRYWPATDGEPSRITIDGVDVGMHLGDARLAVELLRKVIPDDPPMTAMPPEAHSPAVLAEALRRLAPDPLATLVIHAQSGHDVAVSLSDALTLLPRSETSDLFFSTLQFQNDPTLRVMGVIDDYWSDGYPPHSLHVDLAQEDPPAMIVTGGSERSPTSAMDPSPGARQEDPPTELGGASLCPRCGSHSVRQQIWGDRIPRRQGLMRLLPWRRADPDDRWLSQLAPYDCAACGLTFTTTHCTPVLIAGPRRSGVTTLAAALGAGIEDAEPIFPMRATVAGSRCAFELEDIPGRWWLVLDEGPDESVRRTLTSLSTSGVTGLLLYLADPTQFPGSNAVCDRPGSPGEVVTGFEALRTLAPDWLHCLVVTKCDRLVRLDSLGGTAELAREILTSITAQDILDLADSDPALPLLAVGGLQEGPRTRRGDTLTAIASIMRDTMISRGTRGIGQRY